MLKKEIKLINCSIFEYFSYRPSGGLCIPGSILELWSYDYNKISNLTEQEIKNTINTAGLVSPMTGRNITIERLIGGPVKRDQNGRIISASVLKVDYKLKKQDVFDKSSGKDVRIFSICFCFFL